MNNYNENGVTLPEDYFNNHYGGDLNPFEPIKIIDWYDLNFNLGNVVKYVLRGGKKDNEPILKELKKARFYLDREIKKLERLEIENQQKTRLV